MFVYFPQLTLYRFTAFGQLRDFVESQLPVVSGYCKVCDFRCVLDDQSRIISKLGNTNTYNYYLMASACVLIT